MQGEGGIRSNHRTYDYQPYDDIGPNRPVFKGTEWPLPRRCATKGKGKAFLPYGEWVWEVPVGSGHNGRKGNCTKISKLTQGKAAKTMSFLGQGGGVGGGLCVHLSHSDRGCD